MATDIDGLPFRPGEYEYCGSNAAWLGAILFANSDAGSYVRGKLVLIPPRLIGVKIGKDTKFQIIYSRRIGGTEQIKDVFNFNFGQ